MILVAASIILSGAAANRPQQVIELARAKIVDCGQMAEEILANNDGRLLSIRPHDDRCTIVVLVTKEGERPRKVIFRVPQAAPTEEE
ncbi:hypothetical protein HJA95_09565 [Rhizobium binae]|uniref:hypothetical protein n=1 Tax=Rhizobium binae TaxID=1138190 RepID=UPI001C8347D0|nr:hypothetical protein [Rhizobium binae]MBX4949816.1 hypothetical protein [Rhizobium binae]